MTIKINDDLKIYSYTKGLFFLLALLMMMLQSSLASSQDKLLDLSLNFKKYIKNYNISVYNHLQSNRIILQDKRGIIYVGNFDKLTNSGNIHQYDGVSWRIINAPQFGIFSMAMNDVGKIFIGGYKEFGFLSEDSKGMLKYKSIVDQLDDDKRDFTYVFSTYTIKDKIYFICRKYIYQLDSISMKIKVWKPMQEGEFASSFLCMGKFYVQQKNIGLVQLKNDKLEIIPGSKMFKNKIISMMTQYNSQSVLIGTRINGFYLFDGSNFSIFPTEVDAFIKEKQLRYGIQLSNGDFALGTVYGGLIITDNQGRMKEIYKKSNGLLDNDIYYVFEDREGNIWLAMEAGVSRIEYNSPVSINDELSLYFFSIVKHNGVLYTGTENGLYYLSSAREFKHMHGTSGAYFALQSIDDSIFAATNKGVFQFIGEKKKVIINKGLFFVILHSQFNENRIWVAGKKGLFSLYKKNNGWQKEYYFKSINNRIESIVEDEKGNLWLGLNCLSTPTKITVLKVDFPGDGTISSAAITGYRITSQKLSHYASYVYKFAGHIIFSTEKGLFRFDRKNKEFIPDFTLGTQFAGNSKTLGHLFLVEDRNKNVWFRSKTWVNLAKFSGNGSYIIQSKPFRRINSFYWFPVYPDPYEDVTWVGGKGKLIRYNTAIKKNYEINFPTLVRRVLANGSLVFDGNPIISNNETQSMKNISNISYQDRNLRFEFAAPFFADETKTQYRYFLEGYDKDWSDWGRETKREYNSLAPGLYRFRVQSKNIYQHPGSEAVFQFRILLPWYRAWWAFFTYAVVLIIVTYLMVKWRRSFQLEKEKQKLEQTVNERTKEIKVKNQQLEEQSEKLKEMDKVKSRFFANISHEFRTPLTLIIGPLEQLLYSIQNKIQKRKVRIALQNSQRLLGLINQLLDLSKLDCGRMKLQASLQNIILFIRGIVSSFEPVTEEKKLNLILIFQKEDITLYFDFEKLEHVILNLLGNAVKFTPAGGKIMISVTEKIVTEPSFPLGLVELSLKDTGPGIPRNELSHIFDRFYQSDNAYEKHLIGTGIGLALAKELVELHHGELVTHSIENEGTEFIIRLPLGNSHLNREEIVANLEKPYKFKIFDKLTTDFLQANEQHLPIAINDNKVFDEFKYKGTYNGEPFPFEENFPLKSNKNIILVVEDNADLRDYIKDSLEPLYEVLLAKDGRTGIENALEVIPDLIISDIMMPEADGFELCRHLKKHIHTRHIPIILLTAKASEENIVEGFDAGADDYIIKPFSTKILCARIKNLIDLRHQLHLKRKRQITLQPQELSGASMDEEFYNEVQAVIDKNISDSEFNVDKLAKKLYMGRTSLYRKMLALTGVPPNQFIRTYRLKRAAQLLKANFGNVTEVAEEVGFHNIAYFSKCFKKEFHQLPSNYQSSEDSGVDYNE